MQSANNYTALQNDPAKFLHLLFYPIKQKKVKTIHDPCRKSITTCFRFSCFFLISCSPHMVTNKPRQVSSKEPPFPGTTTSKKSTRRGMQKYYRSSGTATGTVYIVIDKSDYELRVYDARGLYAVYPVVFGLSPLEDKLMQGDRKIPEGNFKIIYNKQHSLWRHMMMLNYPTKETLARFAARKKNGQVPSTATAGNGIGIHGVETGNDYFIDHYYNWTNGCISLKNHHIDDLAKYINPGTSVKIQR